MDFDFYPWVAFGYNNSGLNTYPGIMKSHREFILITTKNKEEIINITPQIEKICRNSKIKEGITFVFPHHTSSAVYISDSDKRLTSDFLKVLSNLVPSGGDYVHNKVDSKENADAHIKATLTGHNITIPISNGKLDLGQYETIYYAEFDGMREKEILVKIIGEE